MMFSGLRRKIDVMWMKNGVDVRVTLTGSLPRFLKAPDDSKLENEVPVFCFHSVQANQFEEQLRYLATNGYQTLAADELLATLRGERPLRGRTVALTFDDATGSFWAVAFPLLQKYQFTAILFVIPGLVPADTAAYPNLEDVWQGNADLATIANRERVQPLCTWPELMIMHESGLVDVQSHSLTHARINISPKVVDFVHPHFDPHFFENVNVPVARNDDVDRPSRPLHLGQPIYESASRLSGQPRFLENTQVSQRLVQYVAENGGPVFFRKRNWRTILMRHYKLFLEKDSNTVGYESRKETKSAISREMLEAKRYLETKFGKPIRYFCYPWFQGSTFSDQIAAECGYHALFYGLSIAQNRIPSMDAPACIQRISEEYLFCLPGDNRCSISSVWTTKFARFLLR